MEDMKKVCVVSCPISTRSGYGARSRDFVRALIQAKPDWDVKILSQRWGNTPMDALTAGIDDDLLKRIIVERQRFYVCEVSKLRKIADLVIAQIQMLNIQSR